MHSRALLCINLFGGYASPRKHAVFSRLALNIYHKLINKPAMVPSTLLPEYPTKAKRTHRMACPLPFSRVSQTQTPLFDCNLCFIPIAYYHHNHTHQLHFIIFAIIFSSIDGSNFVSSSFWFVHSSVVSADSPGVLFERNSSINTRITS